MAVKKLDVLGQEIFEKRYAYPGEKTWTERAKVIARHNATAEKDEEKESIERQIYAVVSTGDFVPAGRVIFGSGRNNQNLLNCYGIEFEDNVASISKILGDMYKISCGGGGLGFNGSKIRPIGDDIGNIKNSAPGMVSVAKMINEVGEHVRSGKNRRTALLWICNVEHPELFNFLHVKLDQAQLNNFNISVGCTDRFYEAIENDEEWTFRFGNREYFLFSMTRSYEDFSSKSEISEVVNIAAYDEEDALERARQHLNVTHEDKFENVQKQTIMARDLWKMIWKNAVQAGCPGIFNVDRVNQYTNVSYFETLPQPNPCGEANLPSYGNCDLGSINLPNFYDEQTGDVDWNRLARAVRIGVRFLDNVLTVNDFPIGKCREVAHRSRRIGLGVMGYHYLLIKLGLVYGSEKSLQFTERLFETIRNEAYKASAFLARDKGPFSEFDYKKFLSQDFAKDLNVRTRMLIKKYGIRNAVMLSIAPTGTISMLMGVSSGIEPIFSAMYKRRYREGSGWKETFVMDPLFKEFYKKGKSLDAFVGAYDVSPEDHIKVQATIQRYIDQSISKTINLPEDTDADSFSDMILEYAPNLKGTTVYRAGSKGQEPLEAIPFTKENIDKYFSLLNEDSEEQVLSGDVCSLEGGNCGD